MVHQQVQAAIKSLELGKRADAILPLREAVADKDTQAVRLLASILDRQEYEAKFFDGPSHDFTIQDWVKEASAQLAEGDGFAGYVLAAIAEQRCESPDIALDYYRQGSELNHYECAVNFTLYRANPRDGKSSWQTPVIQDFLDSDFKLEQFEKEYFSALIDTQDFVQSSVLEHGYFPKEKAEHILKKMAALSRISQDGRSFLSAFTLVAFFAEFPEDALPEVALRLAEVFANELNADNQAKLKKFEAQSEFGDSNATFALVQMLQAQLVSEEASGVDEADVDVLKNLLQLARRGTIQGSVECAGVAFEVLLDKYMNQDESSSSASGHVTEAEVVDFGTISGFLREQTAIGFLIWFYGESSRADVAAFWEQRKAALGSNEEMESPTMSVTEFIQVISTQSLNFPDLKLANSITTRHLGEMELSVAGLSIVADSGTDWFTFETGFDCWTHIATIHESEMSMDAIGLLVTTYGPWTSSPLGRGFLNYVESLEPGDEMPSHFMLAGTSNVGASSVTSIDNLAPRNNDLKVKTHVVVVDEPIDDVEEYLNNFADNPSFEDVVKLRDLPIIELTGNFAIRNLGAHTTNHQSTDVGEPDGFDLDEEFLGVWNEQPLLLIRSEFLSRLGIA